MIRNLYLILALCLFFPVGLFAQADTLQTVVYFDVGQSALRADARASLDALLQRRGVADWVQVQLTGRTDFTGDSLSNLRLSERRVQSVQAYLAAKGGLQPRQFKVKALGKANPLGDYKTPAGKSINRSVAIQCRLLPVPTLPVVSEDSVKPDTVADPPIQQHDSDCKLDTTIVLPQGTLVVFNRCEYLELQDFLVFEEALSARAALANGLTTMDSLGRTLQSSGMIRITLKPGSPKECFDPSLIVRIPIPKGDCNACLGASTLFDITSQSTWNPTTQDDPKIEAVEVQGISYYQFRIKCWCNWKNIDCPVQGNSVTIKAPRRHKLQSVSLSMECPMVVLTKAPEKDRLREVVFSVPCPKSKIFYQYIMVDPKGKTIEVKNKPLEELRGKRPVDLCKGNLAKPIRRVLGIFPVYRYELYHTYFLPKNKKRAKP